jgi:hypothetical protein
MIIDMLSISGVIISSLIAGVVLALCRGGRCARNCD